MRQGRRRKRRRRRRKRKATRDALNDTEGLRPKQEKVQSLGGDRHGKLSRCPFSLEVVFTFNHETPNRKPAGK